MSPCGGICTHKPRPFLSCARSCELVVQFETMSFPAADSEHYREALASARSADLTEVEARDVCRVWHEGTDSDGCRVVVLTPSHLGSASWENAFQLFIRESDEITKGRYRIVIVNSGHALTLVSVLWVLRRARAVLPERFRRNLCALSVVHPDIFVRFLAYTLKPFMSYEFWDNIQFADRIEELVLDGTFDGDDISTLLPDSCRQFEVKLELDAVAMREQAREKNFGGIDSREDALRHGA